MLCIIDDKILIEFTTYNISITINNLLYFIVLNDIKDINRNEIIYFKMIVNDFYIFNSYYYKRFNKIKILISYNPLKE